MRLLRAFLAASLAVGAAAGTLHAEAGEARPARAEPPPYRLVRIIAETHQALLFDKTRATHVLVDAGSSIGGFDVIEIDDDQIVLARPGESREFVLIAGETSATPRVVDPYPTLPPPPPGKITFSAAMLLDPYPEDVLDPYGSDGVRTVQAPEDQRAPDEPAPLPEAAEPPEPKPAPPPKVDHPREQSFTVTRTELDAALGDFDAIAENVEMSLVDGGVELVSVKERSFFHIMGLRDGDLVRTVDGTKIRGLDDAAGVYARLAKATTFVVEVTRAGAPLTLNYKISTK